MTTFLISSLIPDSFTISSISINIIISTIKATTTSISSLISLITTDKSKDMEHITKCLRASDLQFTVLTIKAFINEQKIVNTHESINSALAGVSDILTTINDTLQTIKTEHDTYKSKYFSSYRTFAWSGNIDTLKEHDKVLKHRYNILFELFKIYRVEQK